MEENKIIKEALRIRQKRLHMKLGYAIIGGILGLIGAIGIVIYLGWMPLLFIILLMWGNNLGNTSKEL